MDTVGAMGRRPILLPALVLAAAALLGACGSADGPVGPDSPVTTTAPLRTTLLESAPVTLPPSSTRPAGVDASALGYDVAGTGGVWIQPNGDAVVVGCAAADPDPAIRAAGIPGYRGVWRCV